MEEDRKEQMAQKQKLKNHQKIDVDIDTFKKYNIGDFYKQEEIWKTK